MNKILIVDASPSDGKIISGILTKAGYDPVYVENIEAGKQGATKLPPEAIIVTAMRLSDGRAIGFIDWLKVSGYKNPVIVILDGYNPHEIYEVLHGHRAIDIVQRKALDKTLIETIRKYEGESFISFPDKVIFPRQSRAYKQLLAKVGNIANSQMNVLIVGEGGVGKEPISEEIYRQSNRKDRPCVIIDALVLQHQHAEKTTVYDEIKQLLRKAVGGTVVIDHVHLLSTEMLNIVSGILKAEQYDIRFISITDKELSPTSEIVRFGSFLHYKLSQYVIKIPPLRESRDDIIPLAEFFLKRYCNEFRLEIKGFDSDAKKKMLAYSWPGNIRELKNAIRIAAIEATQEIITAKDLEIDNPGLGPPPRFALRDDGDEKARIITALEHTGGKRQEAAALLKINRNTLQNKIKKYGIDTKFK